MCCIMASQTPGSVPMGRGAFPVSSFRFQNVRIPKYSAFTVSQPDGRGTWFALAAASS